MYVVIVEYIAPVAKIEAALDRHRQWLEKHYMEGVFLLSGRQEPRVGGVILAADLPREELDALLVTDPLVADGLATDTVTELHASRATTPELWGQLTPQG